MFGLQGDHIVNHKKRLKELLLRSEEQEARFEQIYAENKISGDELIAFLSDPANFDHETWQAMEQLRKETDAELQSQLNQVKNPLKSTESYSELRKTQQWIPV